MVTSFVLFDQYKMCLCDCCLSADSLVKEKMQQYADAAGNDRFVICEIDGDWRDYFLDDITASCIWQIENKENEYNEQSRAKQAQED